MSPFATQYGRSLEGKADDNVEGRGSEPNRQGRKIRRREGGTVFAPSDGESSNDTRLLKPCKATADELAVLGASSVMDLVARMNKGLIAKGLLPISQGDYPKTRKRLLKLLERWKRSGH